MEPWNSSNKKAYNVKGYRETIRWIRYLIDFKRSVDSLELWGEEEKDLYDWLKLDIKKEICDSIKRLSKFRKAIDNDRSK